MNFSQIKGISDYIDAQFAAYAAATAAGTGDATQVNGDWLDRQQYQSCAILIGYRAVLADTKTISIAANLQDAVDSSGTAAANFGVVLANAVRATAAGSQTKTGILKLGFDLTEARRWIRIQATPDLSNTATDTAILFALCVFGPAINFPASAKLNV